MGLPPRIVRSLGACLPCIAPWGAAQSALPFTEEAVERGVIYLCSDNNLDGFGTGVCFADLDMDGDPDIVLIGENHGIVGVFENDGTGHFADRSAGTGLGTLPGAVGISATDYDADGDLDLFVSVHQGANALLRNDGNFKLKNIAAQAGVAHVGLSQGSAWGDYDRDGWPDLYVSIRKEIGGGNLLYRNLGNGTFQEVAALLGVDMEKDGMTFHTSFVDYNHDRLPDLYLCTDKGQFCTTMSNHLFENQGQTFVEVTEQSGTQACVACMGTAVGDFDGNGHTDFYCSNIPSGNVLLLNQGDETFLEQAQAAGLRSYLLGWSTLFFDYDNDARLDLYVCNFGPNRLYDNDHIWPCPDVAVPLGVEANLASYCSALADIDGDGDLDMLIQNVSQPIQLYVNHEGSRRNWLQVKVLGNSANTQAIGARVIVRTGARAQYREIRAGVGFKSQSSLVASFGLDGATIVNELRVEWPLGGDSVRTNVAVNRHLTIHEGESVEVRSRALVPR